MPSGLPPRPRYSTSTRRRLEVEPLFAAKKRIDAFERPPMQTGPVVAELPSGSASAWESAAEFTAKGSFPATTVAAPVSVQPLVPLSKPPFGASWYRPTSPQPRNG
jgi:hypothetical protein